MTVLVLIVLLLAQVVQATNTSIQRTTNGMDNNQLSTVALDRLGNGLAGMIASGQGTLIAVKSMSGSDGLVMLTNNRVRSRTDGTNINASSFSDIRLGARGYCVINTADPDLRSSSGTGSFPSVPMLNWGDGTVTWSAQSAAAVQGDPLQALFEAASDLTTQMNNAPASGAMLQFTPLSRGIFRFEICFLLSNGSLLSTTTPPLNKHLITGGTGPTAPTTFPNPDLPLAFKAADSNDTTNAGPNGQPLYVRAIVVGIASLDVATQKTLQPAQWAQLANVTTLGKTTDGQTPLQAWDISSSAEPTYQNLKAFPPPVLQNIRFTQRYYYVD